MKPGFQGHDSMREMAEKAIGKAVKGAEKPGKMSASTPIKLQDRLYKKGGHVKPHIKTSYDLGSMTGGDPDFKLAGEKGSSKGHMKKGGKAKRKADGGSIPGQMQSLNPSAPGDMSSQVGAMKRGGKAKKCNLGGAMPALPIGASPGIGGMKKGGKVHKHPKKMAMGGVGKIRHKEMTRSGKPMKPKHRHHDGLI